MLNNHSTTIAPHSKRKRAVEHESRIAADVAAESPSLDVMSFNIRNSAAGDGVHSWENRRKLAFDIFHACDPDLVGFQEVLADQLDDIRTHAAGYGLIGAARDDGLHSGERALIAYRRARFSLIDSGDFWLAESDDQPRLGWDASHIRICSWARLIDRNAGLPLLFANTHWDHQGIVARRMSALLMRRRLSELFKGAAVIVTGDFNSHETDEWVQTMLEQHAESIALADSYRQVHPVRQPDELTDHHFTGETKGMRIDYILHSPGFRSLDARIVRTRGANGEYATDHYPVLSRLDWNKGAR